MKDWKLLEAVEPNWMRLAIDVGKRREVWVTLRRRGDAASLRDIFTECRHSVDHIPVLKIEYVGPPVDRVLWLANSLPAKNIGPFFVMTTSRTWEPGKWLYLPVAASPPVRVEGRGEYRPITCVMVDTRRSSSGSTLRRWEDHCFLFVVHKGSIVQAGIRPEMELGRAVDIRPHGTKVDCTIRAEVFRPDMPTPPWLVLARHGRSCRWPWHVPIPQHTPFEVLEAMVALDVAVPGTAEQAGSGRSTGPAPLARVAG